MPTMDKFFSIKWTYTGVGVARGAESIMLRDQGVGYILLVFNLCIKMHLSI